MSADLHFWFDPVCPFAWMTSKWVREVSAQRDYAVEWRFISLRLINAAVDDDSHFPPEYEAGHTAGLKLLRVAAKVREVHGREAVGPLYAAMGEHIFESQSAGAVAGRQVLVGPATTSSADCWPGSDWTLRSPTPSTTRAGTPSCGRRRTRRSR